MFVSMASSPDFNEMMMMIRTVLLITGSLQNIEYIAGSGINILYLLTGPIPERRKWGVCHF